MRSIQSVTKFGEYIHFIEGLLFDNHGLASRSATKRIVDFIKEIKPDIIQMHCIHGYYLNYKILFEYLNTTDIPIVWTFHDCWAFTGHCAHFLSAGCYRWRDGGCHHCPLSGDYPKSIFDGSVRNYKLKERLFKCNRNLHIVTVSKWLESVTRESFFCDHNIQTIYNGIDTKVFYPRETTLLRERLNLQDKKVLVAAATSWYENKGLNDYKELSNALPDDVVILLIGLTEDQIKALPAKIIGLKRTNSATELAQFYSMADIVLNLSYQETFGLTTVEGMACGTPGIVYNTTASPELLSNETGLVIEAGDIEGVNNAVRTLIEKGKRSFTSHCVNRVYSLYNKDTQFQKYINYYESLLN
jgi:glycosyltransferase involved in cell wall biosynthesis